MGRIFAHGGLGWMGCCWRPARPVTFIFCKVAFYSSRTAEAAASVPAHMMTKKSGK